MHPVPLNPSEEDESSDLYLSERYVPAAQRKLNKSNGFKEKFLNFFKRQRDKILFNESMHVKFPSLTDLIIKHFFKDLDIYLTQKCVEENKSDCLAKDVIRDRITDALKKNTSERYIVNCSFDGNNSYLRSFNSIRKRVGDRITYYNRFAAWCPFYI